MRFGNSSSGIFAAIAFLVMCCVQAGTALADEEREFEAVSLEYNINASPQIRSRKFKSDVTVFEQGMVKVVQLKNYLEGKRKPDVLVKIAVSSQSVGSIIYNSNMEVVSEFTKGRLVNQNLYAFEDVAGERKITGRWFLDDDYLMSDFSVSDGGGILLKETVIYRAKRPLGKKR